MMAHAGDSQAVLLVPCGRLEKQAERKISVERMFLGCDLVHRC